MIDECINRGCISFRVHSAQKLFSFFVLKEAAAAIILLAVIFLS